MATVANAFAAAAGADFGFGFGSALLHPWAWKVELWRHDCTRALHHEHNPKAFDEICKAFYSGSMAFHVLCLYLSEVISDQLSLAQLLMELQLRWHSLKQLVLLWPERPGPSASARSLTSWGS